MGEYDLWRNEIEHRNERRKEESKEEFNKEEV